jgi:hypothetical protein
MEVAEKPLDLKSAVAACSICNFLLNMPLVVQANIGNLTTVSKLWFD